jgi:serine protease
MDVYSWAADVDTAYTDDNTGTDNLYTSGFGGTSGASPIIVGAAAIVQGIWFAQTGEKKGPLEMRDILASYGTPSANPAQDRIGVQPNLREILDTIQVS